MRSAYRSPEHNRAVGGAKASKHLEGVAFDIAMANHDPEAFEAEARAVGFQGFGFYPAPGSCISTSGRRAAGASGSRSGRSAFATETPPAREVLAESRTLKGGGAAGVATVGAAGVEVAQEALAETQGAILPLVPYLDTLRWLFIASALPASQSRSTRGWMTGRRPAMIAGLRCAARRRPLGSRRPGLWSRVAAVLLLLLSARRTGEQLGRLLERLETSERTHDVQREMLEAAARRPRDRDELAGRLRDGRF